MFCLILFLISFCSNLKGLTSQPDIWTLDKETEGILYVRVLKYIVWHNSSSKSSLKMTLSVTKRSESQTDTITSGIHWQRSSSRVNQGRSRVLGGAVNYISHHGVLKPGSTTTKLRVVSNSSLDNNNSGLSLNNCLPKGPNTLVPLIQSTIAWSRQENSTVWPPTGLWADGISRED